MVRGSYGLFGEWTGAEGLQTLTDRVANVLSVGWQEVWGTRLVCHYDSLVALLY